MTKKMPGGILAQHIAVLGKTGSGKTSTAKLIIEQVVPDKARVCILDPIKSDWWGLTSSRNGKRPGLPFHILGGPRGHVPLHASSGKVIAEIVANGSLPLSIIDMADFAPGGQSNFFVDFAAALLRKMRGVVYLVIEEAHLFAPKERSGIGSENMAIHWAKMLATAGRQKLPAGELAILEVLIAAHPAAVSREEIGDATEYKSSSRNEYLRRLKARQLIEIRTDGIIATDLLF